MLLRTEVHVFSHSVLCVCVCETTTLFRISHGRHNFLKLWDSSNVTDKHDIARRPVQFQWHMFSGYTSILIKREIQILLGSTEPSDHQGQSKFMSMFNDMEYCNAGDLLNCLENAREVTEYAEQFQLGHWCFYGPGQESVLFRTSSDKPAGKWHRISMTMTQDLEGAKHPILFCAEPFLKAALKYKKGKPAIHFQSTTQTKTVIICTLPACTQLCIYVAVCARIDQYNV